MQDVYIMNINILVPLDDAIRDSLKDDIISWIQNNKANGKILKANGQIKEGNIVDYQGEEFNVS